MPSSTTANEACAGAAAAFGRWRPVEPLTIELVGWLLEARATYLGGNPMRWEAGDVRELLLGLCPRRLANDPDLSGAQGPVLADLRRSMTDCRRIPADCTA